MNQKMGNQMNIVNELYQEPGYTITLGGTS
jgi:hypothetical protein